MRRRTRLRRRKRLKRRTKLRRTGRLQRRTPLRRYRIAPASDAQRAKVADQGCLVCGERPEGSYRWVEVYDLSGNRRRRDSKECRYRERC